MSNIPLSKLSNNQFIEKVEEYPFDVFPKIIARAIKKSAFYHHVPIAVAAQTYLAQMSFIAQRFINAPSDKKESGQPASLAVLTVFPSGEGKDVCKDDAAKIAIEVDNTNMQSYNEEITAWKIAHQKNKGERPISPQSIFVRATTQGVLKHMSISPSSSFIWSTGEGGYLFGGYSLQSDTKSDALSTLTDLVDRGTVTTNLGGDDSTLVMNKRFCLDIAVQDVVARPSLENEMCKKQGFFARFLFAAPESLPFKEITKNNRKLKSYDDNDINMYWSLCRELLDPINLAIDTAERQVIMKNDEADDIHIEYENYINFESQKDGLYYSIQANAKRTKQYVLRVAAILSFFESKNIIDAKIMRNAIDICKYSLNQWLIYYNKGEKTDSEILFSWIKEQYKRGNKVILKSSINQNVRKVKTAQLRDAALKYLIEADYINIEEIGKKEYISLTNKALENI